MKTSRLVKAMLACGVVAACLCGLAACSGNGSNGVAATVNGVEIPEQKVTDTIEHIRAQSGLSDDEQWGKFLVQNDMTPESVRSTNIDTMVDQEVIKQGAEALGIALEDGEVQKAIDSFKENYSTDEAWQNALDQAGFTEDSYYEDIEESMIEQKVGDHFEEQAEVTDEDYVSSAQTYATYYNGAKRVSEIVIDVDTSDEEALAAAQEQAADIVSRLNDGSLDFAAAASEYSSADSKESGGDIGWDKLESFDESYADVLTDMEVNQVSEPQTGSDSVYILKVTETYDAPEDSSTITSLDQIPEAFRENIKEMAVSVKANTLYTDWLDEQKENADIQINDMPSGLPYDIDLTKYQEEADAAAAADDATTDDTTATDDATATDGTAEADATVTDATVTTDTTTTDSTTTDATTGGEATTDNTATGSSDGTASSSAESANK